MNKDEKIKRLTKAKRVIYFSIVMIVILPVIVFVLYNYPSDQGKCGTPDEPKAISSLCGNAPNIDPASGLSLEDYNSGKTLFKVHCAVCHSEGGLNLTGPGLKNVIERVPKDNWLKCFILNADSVIKSGDPYANKLYEEYAKAAMPMYKGVLSNKELDQIILYISQ